MLKDFFLKLPPKTKNILIIILVLIGLAIIGSFLPDSENTNSQNVYSQNTANEILKSRDCINKILSQTTGQSIKKIEQDTNRDYYLTSEEAKEYNLIDRILIKGEWLCKKK